MVFDVVRFFFVVFLVFEIYFVDIVVDCGEFWFVEYFMILFVEYFKFFVVVFDLLMLWFGVVWILLIFVDFVLFWFEFVVRFLGKGFVCWLFVDVC